MGVLRGAFFLALLAAAVGFSVLNDQPVSLQYYFGWVSLPLPLFLWVFASFLVGLVLSGLIASFTKIGLKSRILRCKKTITELERKRNALRADPPLS